MPEDQPAPVGVVHDVEGRCSQLRGAIEIIKGEVKELKLTAKGLIYQGDVDVGEVVANITLSYRHLEDARMRLGKAMQALQGGVSILDK